MGSQWGYDRTHIRAKHEGYRSRAAYKLLEIQKKFAVIRPDDNIVDLGAAPGSWLQVERTLTQAKVVGIDLNPVAALAGVETIEGDLNDPEVQEKVRSMLGVVNVVVCDAAPKLSGHKSYDQARIIELNEQALAFAKPLSDVGLYGERDLNTPVLLGGQSVPLRQAVHTATEMLTGVGQWLG